MFDLLSRVTTLDVTYIKVMDALDDIIKFAFKTIIVITKIAKYPRSLLLHGIF